MKKFLAVLFILLLTTGDAFATVQVNFNNAGARSSVSHGARAPRYAHNFGRNAAFLPSNRAYAGTRNRQIQREKAMTRAIASYSQQAQVSRFDKNYTVTTTQKTYTRGGVTYYN